MCKRSMEQYTHPAADERDAAAADSAAPEEGTSCGADAGAGRELAQAEKQQTKGGRASASGDQESARERLKRHRTEMAGRVRIPDMWGQERLLKDWVDCAVFDRPLAATRGLLTARDALVAERAAPRRTTARPLRVHDACS